MASWVAKCQLTSCGDHCQNTNTHRFSSLTLSFQMHAKIYPHEWALCILVKIDLQWSPSVYWSRNRRIQLLLSTLCKNKACLHMITIESLLGDHLIWELVCSCMVATSTLWNSFKNIQGIRWDKFEMDHLIVVHFWFMKYCMRIRE